MGSPFHVICLSKESSTSHDVDHHSAWKPPLPARSAPVDDHYQAAQGGRFKFQENRCEVSRVAEADRTENPFQQRDEDNEHDRLGFIFRNGDEITMNYIPKN